MLDTALTIDMELPPLEKKLSSKPSVLVPRAVANMPKRLRSRAVQEEASSD